MESAFVEGIVELFLWGIHRVFRRFLGKGKPPEGVVMLSSQESLRFLSWCERGGMITLDGEQIMCAQQRALSHSSEDVVGKDLQGIPRWYLSCPRNDGSRILYALAPLFLGRWWYMGRSTRSMFYHS